MAPLAVFTAYGQSVISAHSGVVHYVEGDAFLSDKPVDMKFGHFPDIKPNEIFRTKDGRAEILLAPGSFLRLAENSSIKMVSNQLTDTRFELLEGTILVESVDFSKDSAAAKVKGNVITVAYKDSTTTIDKAGLYEFQTSPSPQVKVYEGEALVKTASSQATLKKGKEAQLEGVLSAEKFDPKAGDELTRWSARRSGYLATANISSAHSMYNDSSTWGSYAGGYMGGWAFNPLFGMYTFVPLGGVGWSPFGYGYFSPYTVGMYYPYPYYGYGYGYYPGYGSGGGTAAPTNTGRRPGSGNFGGNSPIRASASNHVGGAAGSGVSRGSGFSAASSSGSVGGFSRGGGAVSSGAASSGAMSAGGGGGRSGGGAAAGGGRGR
ncbi:MAG: FecR domain-containing protein [Acidobacteriaceae bacterium]|nr:FecR domain-containing protein [Acidobacteriaceae bacterium]